MLLDKSREIGRNEEAEDIEASKICRGRRWWMVVKREAEPQGSL